MSDSKTREFPNWQWFLILNLLFGLLIVCGNGLISPQSYVASASTLASEAFLPKYFTSSNISSKNYSFQQVLYALNMEQKLLQSELKRLSLSLATSHKGLSGYKMEDTSVQAQKRQLNPEIFFEKLVPKLHSARTLFINLFKTVSGVALQILSGTDVGSELTPYSFKQRQKESAMINRLLSAKVAEVTAVFSTWRERTASNMEEKFQTRLRQLQNPENCKEAKKLVCDFSHEACGLGCQLHYLVTCLAASFALNRTTILRLRRWEYTTSKWEDYFVPPSPKCQWSPIAEELTAWSNESQNAENSILYPLKIFDLQPFKPLRVDKNYAERISRFHGRPGVWWVGQLLVNVFHVQPDFEESYEKRAKLIGFKSPIVGIHVRRSDKVASEAKPYDLEQYMAFVEEYYDKLEVVQKVDQRRVFLASDTPYVYMEFRMKYPHYTLVHNQAAAKSSARKATRRSEDSLRGIMIDMYFLARTDHLVCTMSSNVCRIVYELMQTRFADASKRYDSVDVEYMFMGGNPHFHKAVHDHITVTAETSLTFNASELIEVKKTFWNGISRGLMAGGQDRRGSFPAYKFTEDLEVY